MISTIADNLCDLKTAIREGKFAEDSDVVTLLQKIDLDLRGWANPALDPSHTFEPAIDTVDDPDAVYEGIYHVYKSHFVCKSHSSNKYHGLHGKDRLLTSDTRHDLLSLS